MKRLTALICAMVLCMGLLSAQAAGADLTYDRVVEMAQHMRTIASGDYLTMNGVPEDLQRVAREWVAGIDGEPRLVVRMNLENAAYLKEIRAMFTAEHPMVAFEAESTGLSWMISYLFLYAASETVVAESAYEQIAEVNGLLNCEMLYAEEAEPGTGMYVVLYEGASPILIIASAENDAVSLFGVFVPSAKLSGCANYGQVAMWFLMNGFPMTGAQVLPE